VVFIAGSGDVRLHSHPRQLRSMVAGSGQVIELPGGQSTAKAIACRADLQSSNRA
jgi:hypothetical protein